MKILIITLLFLLVGGSAAAQEVPTHTVKAGETLYRIATTNGMTVDELKQLNGLTDNVIHVGQVLILAPGDDADLEPAAQDPSPAGEPVAPPDSADVKADIEARAAVEDAAGPVTSYIVQEGETLYSIAAERGTKAYILFTLNKGLREPIEPGMPIVVPESTTAEGLRTYAMGQVSLFPETYVGRVMAGGAPYEPSEFVVAHRELPFDTVLLVENAETGRASFAKVADRGPLDERRLMEISSALAEEIGVESGGRVRIRLVE